MALFQTVRSSLRNLYIPTSVVMLRDAQEQLLRKFVRSEFQSKIVPLSSESDFLNIIELRKDAGISLNKVASTIVLTHGYGSGLGFYWANLDHLISKYDRVIAVDWLGMGGSSRPDKSKAPLLSPCPSGSNNMTPSKGIDFFIDSLDDFRKTENISNFVLAGHSLGGYLSAQYALKYGRDRNLDGLVMISPVGISSQPSKETVIQKAQLPMGLRAIAAAWRWNMTPQKIVRAMGPRGRDMVARVLTRRFGSSRWDEKEIELIAEYLYHISVAEGSGEYALNSLLEPIASDLGVGVYARKPLTTSLCDLTVPALMLFGDHDWLYPRDLNKYLQKWHAAGSRIESDIVSKAGHHLYIDNPTEFHRSLDSWQARNFATSSSRSN